MRMITVILIFMLSTGFTLPSDMERPPVIDMHMHTYQWNRYGDPPPPNYISRQVPAARTDMEAIEAYMAEMDRYNIVKAVGSAQLGLVRKWKLCAPDRFLAGLQFPRNSTPGEARLTEWPDIVEMRRLFESGELEVMGEIVAAHAGIAPDDPLLEPYFALAEELNIPVCFHTGFSEPMLPYGADPDFRVRYNNPLLLEEVLVRHPKLRIYIAHGGYPFVQETIALMFMYQQVYMDISAINWILPREEFHGYLQQLMRLYLGKRIMFGSDQMVWPDAVGMGIEAVESAPFLTREQKRDILYNNAAGFLRLQGLASSRNGE